MSGDPVFTRLLKIRRSRHFMLIALFSLICTACDDNDSSIVRDVHTTRCISDVTAFDRHEFQCDGVQFKVLLTQECIDKACGLIVDVHGWLSNPDEQEGRSNLARAAMDNGGYIVVQPGELSQPPSWDGSIHYDIVYDFMQQAMDAYDVDRDRVHFTGFSQGGWMTWNFICDHSDIIASAAPVAAPGGGCFLGDTGPVRKVPIFLTSGTKDVLITYYSTNAVWSIAHTLVGVMYDYGMVTEDFDSYEFSAIGDLVVDESGRVDIASDAVNFEIVDGSQNDSFLWTRHTDADGLVFEHLRHTNNHVYPDNPDSLIFPEEPSVWFSVGDAILQFFIENPRTKN
ncbi:MAG: pimeloyl-ACP methyl ester carboxylesterase [Halioglobus sp.]|jgi:pimeloyl-ACP methyl ester carboxylesterase